MIGALKPEYVFQWRVAARRVRYSIFGHPLGPVEVLLPWRVRMQLDPRESIGRGILDLGAYDLPVSEVLWRLGEPGMLAVDAGANIGYMTLLMAAAGGPAGRIVAFEPHPEVASSLEENVRLNSGNTALSSIDVRPVALGSRKASSMLVSDQAFVTNRGTARVDDNATSGHRIVVQRLDDVLPIESIRILKIDVEGHELEVLRGAQNALAARRIGFVVVEVHEAEQPAVLGYLAEQGYESSAILRSFFGPRIENRERRSASNRFEPPSFLAFPKDGSIPESLCRPGWTCLA